MTEEIHYLLSPEQQKIVQKKDCFSFSLDSVLLPNFVTVHLRTKEILDIGCGNAPIPLILSERTKAHITGVEIQKEAYEMAKKSVKLNGKENQIDLIHDDIRHYAEGIDHEIYDVITCNPPYFKVNDKNYFNESVEKTIARHEVKISLEEVVMIASKLLKNNGTFAMVHRTERLLEIFDLLRKYHIEPKRVRFVYEFVHKPSTLVLIEGIKHGKLGLKVESPFIMKKDDGSYSLEYEKFLVEVKSSETE